MSCVANDAHVARRLDAPSAHLVGPPILAAAALSGGLLSIIEKPAERQAAAKIVGPTKFASWVPVGK
jgi:hypothetical protein